VCHRRTVVVHGTRLAVLDSLIAPPMGELRSEDRRRSEASYLSPLPWIRSGPPHTDGLTIKDPLAARIQTPMAQASTPGRFYPPSALLTR